MDERTDLLQTNDHEAIRDDLAGYALGTLDPASAARLEAHLATCPACAAALADYRAVVGVLPLALPASRPPAGARARLLERARGTVAPAPVPGPRFAPRLAIKFPASSLRLALVALLLLVLTGAGVAVNGEFGHGPLPYRWTVAMRGAEQAPSAAGLIVYPRQPGDPVELAELIVGGLPDLPPDRTYQLWYVAPDRPPVDGGVFAVDASGNAAVPISLPPDFRSFVECLVTVEPAGGSPEPTGPDVLRGEWT